MRLIVAATALVLATASAEAGSSTSLCVKGEEAIFSCTIRGRIASLCASSDIGPQKGMMTYRFGKPGAIELTYPEPGTAPSKAFSQGGIARGDYISFTHDNAYYQIYFVSAPNAGYGGVMVMVKGNKSVDLRCAHGSDGLSIDMWELAAEAKLPEDPAQGLGN